MRGSQAWEDIFREYEEREKNGYYDSYKSTNDNRSNHNNQKPGSSKEKKFFETLELPEGSSFDEIKKSYRSLMKKYHPDKFPNDDKKRQAAQNLAQQINEAFSYFEKKYHQ